MRPTARTAETPAWFAWAYLAASLSFATLATVLLVVASTPAAGLL